MTRNNMFDVDMISIHALREEGDCGRAFFRNRMCRFLSTPSARRATCQLLFGALHPEISIHALREEGDPSTTRPASAQMYFYPRPPRGGRPKSGLLSEPFR